MVGSSKTCTGLAEGTSCRKDSSCHIGLSCVKGSCTKLSALGETCAGNAATMCVGYASCVGGVCVMKGSLENGVVATDGTACKSFYAKYTSVLESTCHDGPVLDAWNMKPVNCELGRPCKYGFPGTNETYVDECLCGINSHGSAYCLPGIGVYSKLLPQVIN